MFCERSALKALDIGGHEDLQSSARNGDDGTSAIGHEARTCGRKEPLGAKGELAHGIDHRRGGDVGSIPAHAHRNHLDFRRSELLGPKNDAGHVGDDIAAAAVISDCWSRDRRQFRLPSCEGIASSAKELPRSAILP